MSNPKQGCDGTYYCTKHEDASLFSLGMRIQKPTPMKKNRI